MQSTPRAAHPTRRPHLHAMPWVRGFAPCAFAAVIVGPDRFGPDGSEREEPRPRAAAPEPRRLAAVPEPEGDPALRRVALVVAALDRHGVVLVEDAVLDAPGASVVA